MITETTGPAQTDRVSRAPPVDLFADGGKPLKRTYYLLIV